MFRRRLMLIAVPFCVVVVAASVAFASTAGTELTSDANRDDLHAKRPIAASPNTAPPAAPAAPTDQEIAAFLFVAQLTAVPEPAPAPVPEAPPAPPAEPAPPPAPAVEYHSDAGGALACIRARESDSAGGYQAVSPGGTYHGAYQFLQSTWDSTARAAGRYDLVGVPAEQASPADQDALASFLYAQAGSQPWGGGC